MKALVYNGVGKVAFEDRPLPEIKASDDVIVKLTHTTICGTDLHICKGDVATCTPGRILGHEGVGIVHEVGRSIAHFKIDGTQAEFVRVPHGDSSLYAVPKGVEPASLVNLSDIFPTALECGVLNSRVQPGSTVAIIGSGPVGLAAVITAQLYSPAKIIVVDMDDKRLEMAYAMGAYATINPSGKDVTESILGLTGGKGCDAVIEAVGVPKTFEVCQKILAPGGVLANVGVHGSKADLYLDELWSKNISITTRLVDAVTTPMLLKMTEAKKLHPDRLVTHRFKFQDMEKAYKTFGAAAEHGVMKILIEM